MACKLQHKHKISTSIHAFSCTFKELVIQGCPLITHLFTTQIVLFSELDMLKVFVPYQVGCGWDGALIFGKCLISSFTISISVSSLVNIEK